MSTKILHIVAISDTHNKHALLNLPACEILIHSGDATSQGTVSEMISFFDWFSKQNAVVKIFVAGNHDKGLYNLDQALLRDEMKSRGIIYLENEVYIHKGFKIYGSPYTPRYGHWAFMKDRVGMKENWELIPDDVDILVTHGPARFRVDSILEKYEREPIPVDDDAQPGWYNILGKALNVINPNQTFDSNNQGCFELKEKLDEMKVPLHISGHLHESGQEYVFHNGTFYVNAAALDGSYDLRTKNYMEIDIHYSHDENLIRKIDYIEVKD